MTTLHILKNLTRTTEDKLATLTHRPYWLAVVTVCTLVIMLFFAFPSVEALPITNDTWNAVRAKSADLTYNTLQDYNPASNASKVQYRLLMPAVGRLFGGATPGFMFLQLAAGVLTIITSTHLAYRITDNRTVVALMALLVASTHAGRTGFIEWRGVFDAVSIVLLLAAMLTKKPPIIALCVTAAAWNDERGLIASSLLVVWFLLDDAHPQIIGVISGWLLYGLTRYAYATWSGVSIAAGGVGGSVLLAQLESLPFGLWTALEGGWLLVLIALMHLLHRQKYLALIAWGGALSVILVVGFSVFDITRSVAYAIPSVFIALKVIHTYESPQHVWYLTLAAACLTIIWPAYAIGGTTILWQYPLPLQVARWLLQ